MGTPVMTSSEKVTIAAGAEATLTMPGPSPSPGPVPGPGARVKPIGYSVCKWLAIVVGRIGVPVKLCSIIIGGNRRIHPSPPPKVLFSAASYDAAITSEQFNATYGPDALPNIGVTDVDSVTLTLKNTGDDPVDVQLTGLWT